MLVIWEHFVGRSGQVADLEPETLTPDHAERFGDSKELLFINALFVI